MAYSDPDFYVADDGSIFGANTSSVFNLPIELSSLTQKYITDPLASIGINFSSGSTGSGNYLDRFTNWLSSPFGSGKDATTWGQVGLGALSMIQNQRNMNKALAEARDQFNWQKDITRSNFQNQGTNFLNQSLWQLQSLNDFNPNSASQRASDLSAGVSQLNSAADRIGIGGAFNQQADAIAKYNTLKPTVGA